MNWYRHLTLLAAPFLASCGGDMLIPLSHFSKFTPRTINLRVTEVCPEPGWTLELAYVQQYSYFIVSGVVHPDFDWDGLTNLNEAIFGLDPSKVDTDDDGFTDLYEAFAPTEERCNGIGDADEDGLSDCDEVKLGLENLNPDSDGDLIVDGVEVRYGLDPLVPDAEIDSNANGLSNLEDVMANIPVSEPSGASYAFRYEWQPTPDVGPGCSQLTVRKVLSTFTTLGNDVKLYFFFRNGAQSRQMKLGEIVFPSFQEPDSTLEYRYQDLVIR